MKKYFIALCLLVLPLSVDAVARSEEFYVGDDVSVNIDGKRSMTVPGTGFHVLKDSAAGEQYVTLLYDGYILTGNDIVFDDIDLENEEDENSLSNNFHGSDLENRLNQVIADEGWGDYINGNARLLQESDLTSLGLSKNKDNNYEIFFSSTSYFLAPIFAGLEDHIADANYWTEISFGTDMVYVTQSNPDYTEDGNVPIAYIKPVDIKSGFPDRMYTAGIRPVVVVDKEYILCNNTEHTTEPTTKPSTEPSTEPTSAKPPENTGTGISDCAGFLAGIIIFSGVLLFISRKNDRFMDI